MGSEISHQRFGLYFSFLKLSANLGKTRGRAAPSLQQGVLRLSFPHIPTRCQAYTQPWKVVHVRPSLVNRADTKDRQLSAKESAADDLHVSGSASFDVRCRLEPSSVNILRRAH